MKNVNLQNVDEAKEYQRLVSGGYICKITSVEDVAGKEYLKIEYDIADGEFKDYFKHLFEAKTFWGGKFIKSYKETALPFFKAFITAVENSNKGYKFVDDEKSLIGKLMGLVLGEEEYVGNDGSTKTRLYVSQVRSVESIKKNDFTIPELKRLAPHQGGQVKENTGFMNIPDGLDEELPFN